MRLLHIAPGIDAESSPDISLREFLGSDFPPYAILSHRWREEEVLYVDMAVPDRLVARMKKGYPKLETACRTALAKGLSYLWTDTCCIDKTSSAELSEAINSMYSYYASSAFCIAYLDDVESDSGPNFLVGALWFTRGWTLQELIAPKDLVFYSKSWMKLGSKALLCSEVYEASGITKDVLRNRNVIEDVGISRKMSWAARRTTTRPEDEAYSLMGLFKVNMPTLYGEGRYNAFRRLQLEIMQTTTDHTLFVWNSDNPTGDMLAPSVSCFADGSEYDPGPYDEKVLANLELLPNYDMTNAGLRIQLPMRSIPLHEKLYFAFLACRTRSQSGCVPAICLRFTAGTPNIPRYSRHTLHGRAIFHLPRPTAREEAVSGHTLQPIWISASRLVHLTPLLNPKYEVLRAVKYNVWVQALRPWKYVHVHSSRWFANNGEELADCQVQTWSLKSNTTLPVQHNLTGMLSSRSTRHEVVTFIDQPYGLSLQPDMVLAFGFTDKQIWVSTNVNVAQGSNYTSSIFEQHTLLVGQRWFDLQWAKSVHFISPNQVVRAGRLDLQSYKLVGDFLFTTVFDQLGKVTLNIVVVTAG